jgi:hypothetical protein
MDRYYEEQNRKNKEEIDKLYKRYVRWWWLNRRIGSRESIFRVPKGFIYDLAYISLHRK